MVGGAVDLPGGSAPPGVEKAVLPGRVGDEGDLEAEDDDAAQQAEPGSHPAHVQRVAEGHEVLRFVRSDGEPDGRYATKNSCVTKKG